jgi:hypothetical protein
MTPLPQARFSLDQTIDLPALAEEFARCGRVQIAPFLETHVSAERLLQHVCRRKDWRVTIRTAADQPTVIDRSDWEALRPPEREGLMKLAAPDDVDSFRYVFEEIVTVGPDFENREPGTFLGQFADFMSTAPVLDAIRRITGATDIAGADLRATCYRSGHFLTRHNDTSTGMRRVAYVLGLTPRWRPEWGGMLMFHNERGDVELGLMPRMNVLNIFAVPQIHSVSLISSSAPDPRYAVTGWFRARTPGKS